MSMNRHHNISGLVQDCSISSALAIELPLPCGKPVMYVLSINQFYRAIV